jgi:hypothetical protein
MSQDPRFLKNTLDLIETDPEIKSFIYQQINDFNAFVTPDTLVMVIARDPLGDSKKVAAFDQDMLLTSEVVEDDNDEDREDLDEISDELKKFKYRIAIILKEGEHSLEAESFSDDIFDAIHDAKEMLIVQLLEIQEEVENPLDRIKAIQQASDYKPIH